MARCKLTNMNLRNIRKTREYQCLLIDLVKTGVVGKSAAEGLLGYTIPEGLLGDTTPVTPPDDDNGDEEEPRLITLVSVSVSNAGRMSPIYDSFTYDLNDGDTADDILTAANDHWPNGDFTNGNPFNTIYLMFEDVNGDAIVDDKTYAATADPGVIGDFEPGMVIEVRYTEELVENPSEEDQAVNPPEEG